MHQSNTAESLQTTTTPFYSRAARRHLLLSIISTDNRDSVYRQTCATEPYCQTTRGSIAASLNQLLAACLNSASQQQRTAKTHVMPTKRGGQAAQCWQRDIRSLLIRRFSVESRHFAGACASLCGARRTTSYSHVGHRMQLTVTTYETLTQ